MDDRAQEVFRVWRSDPGDRDAFDQWWHTFMRSEGVEPFEARILASGLFEDSGVVDDKGDRLWIHRATGLSMQVVRPPTGPVTINAELSRQVGSSHPFLIATARVTDVEWCRITGGTAGTPTEPTSVRWNRAAGWCEQAKLRLPTHAMWVYAHNCGAIRSRNTGPEFVQDLYDALYSGEGRLPTNPFVAVGDSEYSSALWAAADPATLAFNDFLVSQNLGDDLEVQERISAYGLNVGVSEEPRSMTWVDRSGRERQIEERAGPFPEGVQPPSGATPRAEGCSQPLEPSSSLLSGPFEHFDVGLLGSIPGLDDFDPSGAELPISYEDAASCVRETHSPRAYISWTRHRVRLARVNGRMGRPGIRPVWR